MISSLRMALLSLGVALLLTAARAAEPAPEPAPEVQTALQLGNPMIKGTGPYTVTIEGTASLSKNEKGFTGVSATITRKTIGGTTYTALVNLPDGPPQPGMPGKKVVFTWTVANKGTYTGTAKMGYTNAQGQAAEVQSPIPQFEIK